MESDIIVKIAVYALPVLWACLVGFRSPRPIKAGFFHGLLLWVVGVFLLYSFLPQLITKNTLYFAAYYCITGAVSASLAAAWRAASPQEPPQ